MNEVHLPPEELAEIDKAEQQSMWLAVSVKR